MINDAMQYNVSLTRFSRFDFSHSNNSQLVNTLLHSSIDPFSHCTIYCIDSRSRVYSPSAIE